MFLLQGDALLFWDLDVMGKEGDKYSLHAGCPVVRGTKWLDNNAERYLL